MYMASKIDKIEKIRKHYDRYSHENLMVELLIELKRIRCVLENEAKHEWEHTYEDIEDELIDEITK